MKRQASNNRNSTRNSTRNNTRNNTRKRKANTTATGNSRSHRTWNAARGGYNERALLAHHLRYHMDQLMNAARKTTNTNKQARLLREYMAAQFQYLKLTK